MRALIAVTLLITGCSAIGPTKPEDRLCYGLSVHDCTKTKEAIYYDEQARLTAIACAVRPLNIELEETSRDIWQRTYDPEVGKGHLRITYCIGDPEYPDPLPDYLYDTSWEYPECPSKRSPHCVDGVWEPWE